MDKEQKTDEQKTRWQKHAEEHGIVETRERVATGWTYKRRVTKPTKTPDKRRETALKQEARNAEMAIMRTERGMTLDEIGFLMGITRQRVEQIFAVMRTKGAVIPRYVKEKEQHEVVVRCVVCGLMMEKSKKWVEKTKHPACRKHSSVQGEDGYRRWLKCPRWFEMSSAERQRWKYHNIEGRKSLAAARSRAWLQKIKNDPERLARYRARQKIHTNTYQAKLRKKDKPVPRAFKE